MKDQMPAPVPGPTAAAAAIAGAAAPVDFPADRRWKILVVDDEPANLQVMRGILAASYQLVFAKTGAQALEAARRHAPDLILLDIMMPEMDGYEVCRRLKEDPRLGQIPVIFVTAMSEFEDEARGFAVGGVDYIIKPVSTPIVLARVRNHLCLSWSLKVVQDQADGLEARIVERTRALALEVEERRKVNQMLSAILEASPVAIVMLDPDGSVRSWNRAAEAIYGYPAAEIIGKSYPAALDDGPSLESVLARLAAGEVLHNIERLRRRKDGSVLSLRGAVAGLFDGHGTFQGAVVVSEDVSERKRMEAHLRHAQKMEAIGSLTGGIAHDFNNLLTIVIGNLDLIARLPEGDPQTRDMVQSALAAALRGADLTRQLLAFSRRQTLQPTRVDVNSCVRNMVKLLHRTLDDNLEITLREDPGLWPVLIDAAQLDSAILNLAVNARDAMPDGGGLTISMQNRTIDPADIDDNPVLASGDYITIEVMDSGCGMPAEVAARIFEPFFTTKETGRGTGLGLAMVYGFVKQSGGHISVHSAPGHGTTFRLYLPRAADSGAATGAVVPGAPAVASGKTILAVEDNPMVRKVVGHMLTELGYRVSTVGNAAEAMEVLERGQPVDVVFSDIVMPGEMNGIDLGCEIRRRWPHIKVALTSGFSEDAITRDCCGSGFVVISKPYREQELAQKLSIILEQRQSLPHQP